MVKKTTASRWGGRLTACCKNVLEEQHQAQGGRDRLVVIGDIAVVAGDCVVDLGDCLERLGGLVVQAARGQPVLGLELGFCVSVLQDADAPAAGQRKLAVTR